MNSSNEVMSIRLHSSDGYVVTTATPESLCEQIESDSILQPNTELYIDEQWTPIRCCRYAPWRDRLFRRAEAAFRAGDGENILTILDKLLQFCDRTNRDEIFRTANFLKGTVLARYGRLPEAARCLKNAIGRPSISEAAAHHNLAVVFALLRDPIAAVEHFAAAIERNPLQIATVYSWRNLAATLTGETAPNVLGLDPWPKMRDEQTQRLRSFTRDQRIEAVRENRPYPSYHVFLVFEKSRYCPTIGSGLPSEQTGLQAGRCHLEQAREFLATDAFELAIQFAERARDECPSLSVEADRVSRNARSLSEQRRRFTAAQERVALADLFNRQLTALTLEKTDIPQATIERLQANGDDITEHKRLYREAIINLIRRRIWTIDDDERRADWLMVLSVYETAERSAHLQAAAIALRIQPLLSEFRAAVAAGDLGMAASVAKRVAETHGTIPADLQQIMERCTPEKENSPPRSA